MAFGGSILHTVNWHSIKKGTTELQNSLCPLVAAITLLHNLLFGLFYVLWIKSLVFYVRSVGVCE